MRSINCEKKHLEKSLEKISQKALGWIATNLIKGTNLKICR